MDKIKRWLDRWMMTAAWVMVVVASLLNLFLYPLPAVVFSLVCGVALGLAWADLARSFRMEEEEDPRVKHTGFLAWTLQSGLAYSHKLRLALLREGIVPPPADVVPPMPDGLVAQGEWYRARAEELNVLKAEEDMLLKNVSQTH